MFEERRTLLRDFANKCREHLNSTGIPVAVGKHRLGLSPRSLSDLVEKHTVDFMIDYFGEKNVWFGDWDGYDAVIIAKGPIYVNVKIAEFGDKLEASWVFSASTQQKVKDILAGLYLIKFEYHKEGRDFLEVSSAKVAGPLSSVELICYAKGDPAPCKLRKDFNGTHCHLRNTYFE